MFLERAQVLLNILPVVGSCPDHDAVHFLAQEAGFCGGQGRIKVEQDAEMVEGVLGDVLLEAVFAEGENAQERLRLFDS